MNHGIVCEFCNKRTRQNKKCEQNKTEDITNKIEWENFKQKETNDNYWRKISSQLQ